MTTSIFRSLVASEVKRAELCQQIAMTLCRAAGMNPKEGIDIFADPPNRTEKWTTFYNDARLMVLAAEDHFRAQDGDTPLIRVIQA